MTAISSITEEELHAYLDGELPDAQRASVEAYLREHPDDARLLEAYRLDGESIARIFSHVNVAVPAKREVSAMPRRFVFAFSWRHAAAAVLIFVVGAGAGWFGRQRIGDPDTQRFARQAAVAYLLLNGPEGELLPTSPLDELSRAMSIVLGVRTELHDPSSTGYKIVSARAVSRASGRAVQLVMRSLADDMITFYFEGRPGATETPFRRIAADGVTALVWEDDDLACAIIGTLEPEKLAEVGRRVYEALLG